MQKQNKQEQWEKEFDEKFNKDGRNATKFAINPLPMDIKQFISNLLSQSRQEAVDEIENNKIISNIGYRPSKFRGLSAVAIYNLAIDDAIKSLSTEEK